MTTEGIPDQEVRMEFRPWKLRTAAALRLLAALAALAAPPVLLAAVIGNPLPSWPVDWSRVVQDVQAGLIPSSVWVNVLALAAWTAWAVLAGLLAVEVVAVARNRPSPAGVPAWIRQLAQALVAAAIALAGPGQQTAILAAGGTALVVASAPAAHAADDGPSASQPVGDGRLVTVREGDSWSGFAADVLGDASLGPELRAANLGRDVGGGDTVSESTVFVEPGWRLLIPVHLDGAGAVVDPRREASGGDVGTSQTWKVEPGDHFWGIAEATLTETLGRAPAESEIVPYWRQLIEANRADLLPPGDPNLIYPGQEFVVPAPPAAPDALGTEAQQGFTTPAPEEQPAVESADHAAPTQAVEGTGTPSPAAPQTVDRDSWQAAVEGHTPSAPVADIPEQDGEEELRTALGVPGGLAAGVAAASLLAAGVLATLRWRRRTLLQQRAPGMRLPTPLPDTQDEVAKLDAAAVPEETLDDLATLLASIPPDVHPLLVKAADDGQVTLLFDEQAELPDPPTPWRLAGDGAGGPVGWEARIGDRGPERSFGLPLLVTLGRSGTSTLLANVGAMGTVVVEGHPDEVRRRLRTISLDLAVARLSVPLEVLVVGDKRLGSLDAVRNIRDLAEQLEMMLEEVGTIPIDDIPPRLLVCHEGRAVLEVPDELTGLIGVVAGGAEPGDPWVLELEDRDTGVLRLPDGGSVQLALPDVDPELLDDELDRLHESDDGPPLQSPRQGALFGVDPSSNGHAPQREAATEASWCEVRLLGPVEVLRDGQRVEGLTPRMLEMLVYLATHRDSVTKDRLEDVIWAGAASRSGQRVTSVLTRLRKVLGDGPDGQPLVPRRSGQEPIVLSEHVSTDLDRAFAHLAVARDLPAELRIREMAAALEVVRGEPLEGRAYSWATEICEEAISRLQDAAEKVAKASRESGDLDAAERAAVQGLKLLDPNGWLYLERAHVEFLRGRLEQPRRIFQQYRRKLADDADEIAGTVAKPPLDLELEFHKLMTDA